VVHKPQVVRSLTWRLSKASPGVYRSYRMNNMSCWLIFACVYCALCVGSCVMVLGCMVVPFLYVILVIDVLPLYD
jgi:hypothetical protein